MDLLKYEFTTAPAGSYFGNVGQLVKKIRHYRENVSIDEFKAAIPSLKSLERQLQEYDESLGDERRDYIDEIMAELEQETETEEKLKEEIERYSKIIVATLLDKEFSIDDFSYELTNREAVRWLEFYGYTEEKENDDTLKIVKDVFRSVCSKYDTIFIDSSSNN